jgi:hypothetical protein
MKQIVDEHISVSIPVKEIKTYRVDILWSELIKTPLMPDDILHDIHWVDVRESGFASMKMEDELETYRVPKVTVIRKRPETDDEYVQRLRKEELRKREEEDKERMEYLRLKAKFE